MIDSRTGNVLTGFGYRFSRFWEMRHSNVIYVLSNQDLLEIEGQRQSCHRASYAEFTVEQLSRDIAVSWWCNGLIVFWKQENDPARTNYMYQRFHTLVCECEGCLLKFTFFSSSNVTHSLALKWLNTHSNITALQRMELMHHLHSQHPLPSISGVSASQNESRARWTAPGRSRQRHTRHRHEKDGEVFEDSESRAESGLSSACPSRGYTPTPSPWKLQHNDALLEDELPQLHTSSDSFRIQPVMFSRYLFWKNDLWNLSEQYCWLIW